MNTITIAGRAGGDPEVKYLQDGKAVGKVSVAVRRDREITDWFRVEIWGAQAEVLANYVRKGQMVGFSGRHVEDKWTDKEGQQRSTWTLKANSVHLLSSRDEQAPAQVQAQAPAQAAPVGQVQAQNPVNQSADWAQAPLAY